MARTIYSERLWSVGTTVNSGTVIAPTVPTGFIWDLRDISAINTFAFDGQFVPPLVLIVNGSLTVFKTPVLSTIMGQLYRQECRYIVTPSDTLEATSTSAGWAWSVNGYALTA